MSIAYTCDGCGSSIDDTTRKTYGRSEKCDYCPDCVPKVENFLDAIDAVHEEIARSWQASVEKIVARGLKEVERLPDYGWVQEKVRKG